MAENFETADMIVALGGDINNTVPRYGVTAAECALLQAIHGTDAVTLIKPTGSVKRSNRAEKARLVGIYAPHENSNGAKVMNQLYPGAAARLFERYNELELAEAQFAPGCLPEGFEPIGEQNALEDAEGLASIGDDEPGEDLFAGESEPDEQSPDAPPAPTEPPKVTTTSTRRQTKADAAASGALA